MRTFKPTVTTCRQLAAVGVVCLLAACSSSSPPPSGPSGQPSPSSPGQSGSSPGSPGPSGSPGTPGPSGAPSTPGPSGSPGTPSAGSGQPSSYEPLPGGAPSMPGGSPGGDQGDSGDAGETGTAGTEMPSWVPGGTEAGGGDDEWETSNQMPGTADIPPMPSETAGTPGEPGLDGDLDQALEDFDGEILAEREIIRERSNESAGSSPGSAIPMPASEPGSTGGDAEGPDVAGGPMGVPRARNAPPAPTAGAGQIPDDIPDAKDDDIIARQLREAAMQETDPELKEKLWDEYRRYKGA